MSDQSTFLWEELPVNHSPSQGSEEDWMMSVATWRGSFVEFWMKNSPAGSFGRMSAVSYPAMEVGTLPPSFQGFAQSGIHALSEFWTLNFSESPSAADECLLSDILETGELPQRYYLSARACQGILNRADKRKKDLPIPLASALETIASKHIE